MKIRNTPSGWFSTGTAFGIAIGVVLDIVIGDIKIVDMSLGDLINGVVILLFVVGILLLVHKIAD